jgi:hypothetical protein
MRCLFHIAAMLSCLWLVHGGWASAAWPPSTAAEFPFDFREGLIWVQVRVTATAEPLNFLFDSGAKVSVLHEHTARRLGIRLGAKVKVHGVGVETTGFWPQRLAACVAEVPLPGELLVVDLAKLSRACNCPVDGLIGADFLSGKVVQIDYPARKIRLLAKAPRPAGAQVLPLRSARGVFHLPVRVNGEPSRWVRLDTGCAAALHWAGEGKCPATPSARISIGLTEVNVPTALATVQVGERTFNAVNVGWHAQAIFPGEAGLLGNLLLARSRVTLDTVAGVLVWEDESDVR